MRKTLPLLVKMTVSNKTNKKQECKQVLHPKLSASISKH